MGEKKGDSNITTVILKVHMHCDGCASKNIRHLRSLQGVDTVKPEIETGKITVTGNVDPVKLKENLEKKIKKKVELISPQLNKENNKDTKTSNKSDKKKTEDKKDKETVTTAVLKVALHCQGCIESIGKTVMKTKGVKEMSIDKEKDTVTVKGTMDVKSLVNNLTERLKKKFEVVPPKKEKKEEADNNHNENLEQSRSMEYNMVQLQHQPPYGFGYGYGHGHGYGNSGGYNYGPVYQEQFYLHMQHAQPPPPQMFSDENPNACSLM